VSAAVPPRALSGARKEAALGLLVCLGGIAVTLVLSHATGPTFDEEARFGAVRRATEVARAVTKSGPLALLSPQAQSIYGDLRPFGVLPGLLSGWLGEVLARAGADRLIGSRLGWLLWTGAAPGALFLLVEALEGARAGVLAACALLAIPRWNHAAAAAREPAVVASIWLAVLCAYVRSLPPTPTERRSGVRRRFRCWGPLFAVLLGLGLSTDLATLGVIPLVVIHYSLHRGRTWKLWRRGILPVPSALLWAIGITPIVLLLTSPALWQGGAAQIAGWLLSPLAPTIEATLFRGRLVFAPRDIPLGYAGLWVLLTTPAVLIALGAGGAGMLAWSAVRARRTGAASLGVLVWTILVAVLVGPAVTPVVLTRFPPRVETMLPFIAAASAFALVRVATRFVGKRWVATALSATGLLLVASGIWDVGTASASFGLLAGGTRGALRSGTLFVGDGSEVAALAPALDRLGESRLAIDAPEVPRSYFGLLNETGRLRAHVDARAGGYTVKRGPQDSAMAAVARDGAVLWSLAKKLP
jgi:hypothetical protein